MYKHLSQLLYNTNNNIRANHGRYRGVLDSKHNYWWMEIHHYSLEVWANVHALEHAYW